MSAPGRPAASDADVDAAARVAASPGPISVIIADDHPLFRLALREAIEGDERIDVVAVGVDGQEALDLIRTHRPDVAVLDMRMPRPDGREVVRRVRQDELGTRILFLSEYHGGELVLQALTAGAAGYLSKVAGAGEICSSIVRIAHGEAVLEPIAEGDAASVIAERLPLAVPTVKTHIQNLYAKLGVNDRGAAVAEAMRRGLFS